MAACSMLRVLVTASHDDLTVFALPTSVAASGLARIRTIGGGGCVQPLNFKFVHDDRVSGQLAFTGATPAARFLLVTDGGNKAVHVIDVVHGAHAGYVAAPGSISYPTSVAAWGTKVAVSVYVRGGAPSFVQLYEGTGALWTITRRIIGPVVHTCGVRFTDDGEELVVADDCDGSFCVSLFRVNDGAFVRHLVTGLHECPADVEECGEYGWALTEWYFGSILFAGGASYGDILVGTHGGRYGDYYGDFNYPTTMAFVSGFGLVVRDNGVSEDSGDEDSGDQGRVQIFVTPDAVAMAAMSVMRTTWMATVLRFAISVSVCV